MEVEDVQASAFLWEFAYVKTFEKQKWTPLSETNVN